MLYNVVKIWVVILFVVALVILFVFLFVFGFVVVSLAPCWFNVASRFFLRRLYSLIWPV